MAEGRLEGAVRPEQWKDRAGVAATHHKLHQLLKTQRDDIKKMTKTKKLEDYFQ